MSRFYRFGGETQVPVSDWRGYAFPQVRAAVARELSGYLDLTVDATVKGQLHKDLAGLPTYPTALTQNGGVSVLSTGPERTRLNDGPLGFFGTLSDNEQRLALFAAVGLAGFLGWKWWKGRKR
jgi:hypothetical protein